jgi:hypothetical protein
MLTRILPARIVKHDVNNSRGMYRVCVLTWQGLWQEHPLWLLKLGENIRALAGLRGLPLLQRQCGVAQHHGTATSSRMLVSALYAVVMAARCGTTMPP